MLCFVHWDGSNTPLDIVTWEITSAQRINSIERSSSWFSTEKSSSITDYYGMIPRETVWIQKSLLNLMLQDKTKFKKFSRKKGQIMRDDVRKEGTASFIKTQLFLYTFMKYKVLSKVPFNFKMWEFSQNSSSSGTGSSVPPLEGHCFPYQNFKKLVCLTWTSEACLIRAPTTNQWKTSYPSEQNASVQAAWLNQLSTKKTEEEVLQR